MINTMGLVRLLTNSRKDYGMKAGQLKVADIDSNGLATIRYGKGAYDWTCINSSEFSYLRELPNAANPILDY